MIEYYFMQAVRELNRISEAPCPPTIAMKNNINVAAVWLTDVAWSKNIARTCPIVRRIPPKSRAFFGPRLF